MASINICGKININVNGNVRQNEFKESVIKYSHELLIKALSC